MSSYPSSKKSYWFPIFIIGILFFIFGFITWANSQLIPYLKIACQLTDGQSFYVASAFFAAYFVMSIPSSFVLKKIGFKKGMSLGLFIMAIGAILFIPAAMNRNYSLFLLGLFIIGTGLALLQTASNPYVTILGPQETAANRISIMGIANKLAGISAIYILGYITLKDVDALKSSLEMMNNAQKELTLQELANRVINPYIIISMAFAILAVVLLFINLPEIKDEDIDIDNDQLLTQKLVTKSPFEHRNLLLGVVSIFFYVGAEVISYDAFSLFGKSLGFPESEASQFASYTGYAMLAGYLIGLAVMPKIITQRKALILSSILSIVLVLLSLATEGYIAVIIFALLGLSQALMWPAIWPLALDGLGKHTKQASAYLIMAIVGGAVLPPLVGKISDFTGNPRLSFLIMIPCYLFILFYALNGYRSKYAMNNIR